MSDKLELKTRAVSLKISGERRATAIALFTNRADLDRDAFAEHAFAEGVFPVGRAHDPILGGSLPPFATAEMRDRGGHYSAAIAYLNTHRGLEEYGTSKGLAEAGVRQPVSIGFRVLAVGPVPDHLRDSVDRYITRAEFIELSFVAAGAIPGAELTSIKAAAAIPHAEIQQLIADFERREALLACLKERHGWLALEAASCAIRWQSNGREQVPPLVKFFGPDDRRAGYWSPMDPGSIYVNRDLTAEETVRTVAHEISHYRNPADADETVPRLEAAYFVPRFFESLRARGLA